MEEVWPDLRKRKNHGSDSASPLPDQQWHNPHAAAPVRWSRSHLRCGVQGFWCQLELCATNRAPKPQFWLVSPIILPVSSELQYIFICSLYDAIYVVGGKQVSMALSSRMGGWCWYTTAPQEGCSRLLFLRMTATNGRMCWHWRRPMVWSSHTLL